MSEPCFSPSVQWDPQVEAYLRCCFGEEWMHLDKALSMPPSVTCLRVNTLRASTQEVLQAVVDAQPHHKQQQQQGDEQPVPVPGAAQVQSEGGRQPFIHPCVPCAVMLPGAGPMHINYSATGGREVIISRKAGESVLRGADVFAPGVLACSAHVVPGDLVAVSVGVELPGSNNCGIPRGTTLRPAEATSTTAAETSLQGIGRQQDLSEPEEAIQASKTMAGEGEGEKAQEADANGAPGSALSKGAPRGAGGGSSRCQEALQRPRTHLYVGVGRAVMSRAEMFRSDYGVAISMDQPVFHTPAVPSGLQGRVMLQNLPSVVAAMALKPQPGWRVLDMCASPGGKTTMIAQLMGDKGQVIALDRSHAKVMEVRSLAAELGLTCITAYKMDSTRAVLRPPGREQQGKQGQQQQQQQQEQQPTASEQPPLSASTSASAEKMKGQAKIEARNARRQAAALARGIVAKPPNHYERLLLQQQQGQQQQPGAESGIQAGPEAVQEVGVSSVPGGEATAAAGTGLIATGAAAPQQHEAPAPAGFEPESFDAVLLDAPCSGLGLRPRLTQSATLTYLRQCGVYTRKFLDAAVKLVKPGGRLVFSTCTLNPWENEACVRYVLDKYGSFMTLAPAEPRVGGPGLVGRPSLATALRSTPTSQPATAGQLEQAQLDGSPLGASTDPAQDVGGHNDAGTAVAAALGSGEVDFELAKALEEEVWLTEEEANMVQRFMPHKSNTIGFFIAAFVRSHSHV